MSVPVIETKLALPRVRDDLVARSRLEQMLLKGAQATLTLISAPAGFGKTTLLGTRSDVGGRPVAWVSLDERDQDAATFWTYVLLAVDRAAPGTATAALEQLRSGQADIETVLTALLNELSVLPQDLDLVLDDYHAADGPQVRTGMVFLLDHLPSQVHLVISTRADPGLPLSRLRARGRLVEVRAADLRFTRDEAAAYLNDVNALGLGDDDVATLEARTEGWAAALQLAALSLDGRADRAAFIAGFAGDDRFVVDYLADEVLDRQPADVRRFLLDTSILDRLTGPLCDAVTGRTDGRTVLHALDRANLFVLPLDDRRHWYRYHHLFGDVLRAHLADERPGEVAELHRRAADWFDRSGDPQAAVRHALASGDTDRAAAIVELAIPDLRRRRAEVVTRRWIDDLPQDVARDRPVLAVGFVGALAAGNEFGEIEPRLREVERLLAGPADGLVVVDRAEFARLPVAIETYWSALALVGGDLREAIRRAELALQRADAGDDLGVAAASALIGLASWAGGDLTAAHRGYTAASDALRRAGHVADVLGCAITLADIDLTLGELHRAQQTLERALELGLRDGVRGTADMYVGLARVAWERDRPAEAADLLARADELGDPAGLPQNPYRWRTMLAHLRAAEGDTAAAVALLEDAERVYVGDFSPDVRPIAATRARLLAAAGDIDGALAWAAARGVTAGEDLSYRREYEHVTLARVLLAQYLATGRRAPLSEAIDLLDRLLAAAEEGGRVGTVIELLVLTTLARDADGDRLRALTSLERGVRVAEPGGYVRLFAGEGADLVDLLRDLAAQQPAWTWPRRLHAAAAAVAASAGRTRSSSPVPDSAPSRPVDPLSSRELDVLRLLSSDLDGPAIARRLHVSLATVRTHTQHVYAKLGVNSRRAAVRRAHQLNLFSGTTQP
jgi:LuxR family transcriptional regulator, maltose regulon positive regulatory protein